MKKEFVNGAKLPSSVEELIFFGTMFRPMWTIHNFFTILTFEQPTVMPTTLHFKFRHYFVFVFSSFDRHEVLN
jgi:hypothetical protein